jgi:electron transfer flavoprotein beta subunit
MYNLRHKVKSTIDKFLDMINATLRLFILRSLLRHAREIEKLDAERNPGKSSWFTQGELSLAHCLASIIIPSDDASPGAEDAEVANNLDRWVVNSSIQHKELYSRCFYSFDRWARWKYGAAFMELSPERQLALMKLIDGEYRNLIMPASPVSKVIRKFRFFRYLQKGLIPAVESFPTLVSDMLRIFYTSETSWAWLGYDGPPMPLGYPDLTARKSTGEESPNLDSDSSPPHLDGNGRILVCLKQVPSRYSQYVIDPSGYGVEEENLLYETNETDVYALEEALRLRRRIGCEVDVISVGEKRVLKSLREALAKGADRAVHVIDTGFQCTDALTTARAIASAIDDRKYHLVLTGVESSDQAFGQTGILLAGLLGWAGVTFAVDFDVSESLRSVIVKRELGNNSFERVEVQLPAVLTIQTSTRELMSASLKGILQARKKEIRTLPPVGASLKSGGSSPIPPGELHLPPREKKTIMLEGPPGAVSKVLIEKLRNDAKVL